MNLLLRASRRAEITGGEEEDDFKAGVGVLPEKVRFIDSTIERLRTMAEDAGPKAKAEIRLLIAELKKLGGTKADPPIGAEDSEFNRKARAAARRMAALHAFLMDPSISLDDKEFQNTYGLTKRDLEQTNRQGHQGTRQAVNKLAGDLSNAGSRR